MGAWHGSDVVQACVVQCCRLWSSYGLGVCDMVQQWFTSGSVVVNVLVRHRSNAVQLCGVKCVRCWFSSGSVLHFIVQMWFMWFSVAQYLRLWFSRVQVLFNCVCVVWFSSVVASHLVQLWFMYVMYGVV